MAGDADAAGAGAAASRLEPPPDRPPPPAPRARRSLPQSMRDRFTCRTCNMLCIGYMRLEGHFVKHPDHERPRMYRDRAWAGINDDHSLWVLKILPSSTPN